MNHDRVDMTGICQFRERCVIGLSWRSRPSPLGTSAVHRVALHTSEQEVVSG